MQQELSISQLQEWTGNFTKDKTMPFVTESGLIELSELEEFVFKIKQMQADSVRIYFIRFALDSTPTAPIGWANSEAREGCRWHEGGGGLTQATIAIVPAKNFKLDDEYIFSADDLEADNKITMLMPGIIGKGTGLNPPSPKRNIR